MCGIVGIWSSNADIDSSQLLQMTNALLHRGPDGEGHWISENRSVGLGHRRLSIIDLSANGAQPMHSADAVISFNGEIYNYIELKAELEQKGFVFHTQSDTEVLMAAYTFWDIDCLSHLDGMFAFALYDKTKKELFCARDRFGEKPFYYTMHQGNLYFASEMKALWAVGVPRIIKNSMVYNFLANDLVENPNNQTETFYENIYKLKTACYFVYTGSDIQQKCYWKIQCENNSDLSFEQAAQRFRELFHLSVKRRLRSDVPVGTSLSGGLDSSSVVSAVSQCMPRNYTFSARFPGYSKDEGKYIDIVSSFFHTQHYDVEVNADKLADELDKLLYHQEEPFPSGSIFAQYKVYEAARREKILVMLDGQGADEYLCGYDKDFPLTILQSFPHFSQMESQKKAIFNNHGYDVTFPKVNLLIKYAPSTYKTLRHWKDKKTSASPLGIHRDFHKAYRPKETPFQLFGSLKETLRHELCQQGLEKLLKFADRNSMAHSIEVRLPFLFHELIDFVFSLPEEYLMHAGWSKALLRTAMQSDLPSEISFRRDKIGFEAPTKIWEQNSLLADRLNEARKVLLKEHIITPDYADGWKMLMLATYLDK